MTRVERWPVRQRCRTCGEFFGPEVIRGEFCSYRCAGKAAHPDSIPPAHWPREHVVRPNQWPPQEKRYFFSEDAAKAACVAQQTAYLCEFCWHWHIGTRSSDRPE